MSEYKVTVKCKKNYPLFRDQQGKLVWDGKSKLITLTKGDEFVTKQLFERMKTYIDLDLWQLKLVKVR
jgi:hypothetical protein